MRQVIVLVAMLAGFLEIGGTVLEACGAKFIVPTKSPLFPRAQRAIRPAAILLDQHASDPGVVEAIVELRNVLNGVGHKVAVVTSEAALRKAAGRQKFNVAMMQPDAARRLRNDLTSSSPGTQILPMKDFVSGGEAARVKKEFRHLLKLPITDRDLLSVVSEASK
jgi:hypothetical protein